MSFCKYMYMTRYFDSIKSWIIVKYILHLIPELCYWSSIVYLAACGETLNIEFTLPFNEFVPTTCNTRFSLKVSHVLSDYEYFKDKSALNVCFLSLFVMIFPVWQQFDYILYIFISFLYLCYSPTDVNTFTLTMCTWVHLCMCVWPPQAEDTDMRLSLPECHPSRYPLLTLAKDYQNVKLPPDMFMPGENQGAPPPKPAKSRWRNITHAEWVKPVNRFSLVVGKKASVLAKSRTDDSSL